MSTPEVPGHTVLQIPVPALERFVRGRYRHYDPAFLSADPDYLHAHVTALGPFLDPSRIDDRTRDQVQEIVGTTAAFDFTMDRIDTFPDGIIHLRPEPEEAFAELTRRLIEAFPECPPYGGRYSEVVPHLTLDQRSETVTQASTLAALGADLPIAGRADRLDLAWYQSNGCRLLHRWVLGRP